MYLQFRAFRDLERNISANLSLSDLYSILYDIPNEKLAELIIEVLVNCDPAVVEDVEKVIEEWKNETQ